MKQALPKPLVIKFIRGFFYTTSYSTIFPKILLNLLYEAYALKTSKNQAWDLKSL